MAIILDGKALASEVKNNLKNKNLNPGLAVILVGDDPASHYYVSNKEKACKEVGIQSFKTIMPVNTSLQELIQVIENYNLNPEVDAILLQLPLPQHLRASTQYIIDHIDIAKDVDGLSTLNLGKLFVQDPSAIKPCTPKACMKLLTKYNIELEAKRALVLGRSNLVGKPLALLLNQANATVIMAHSKTINLDWELSQADIVLAAIGSPQLIKGKNIKNNSVLIDIGINSIYQDNQKKLVGDLDFESCQAKALYISPVPGGVGPMTVAMLLENTFELHLLHRQK